MKFFAFSLLAALAATVSGFACTNKYYSYGACCESFSDVLPNFCEGRIAPTDFVRNPFGKQQLYACRNATRSVEACCDKNNGQEEGCLPYDVADQNGS